jgi:broad specificity phosphatase PhoE
MKFIFVRHCEAVHNLAYHEANNDKTVFLRPELRDDELTENGKIQAQTLARELSEKYPNIEAIWSSSLQRCIQTADEIFEECNVNEYYIHDNLIERQTPGYCFNYRTDRSKLKEKYGHINMEYIPEMPSFWTRIESNYTLRSRMYMIVLLLLNLYKENSGVVMIVGHADAIFTLTGKNLKNGEYFEMTEKEIMEL